MSPGGYSIAADFLLVNVVLVLFLMRHNLNMIGASKEPLLDPRLFANSVFTTDFLTQTVLYLIIPGIPASI